MPTYRNDTEKRITHQDKNRISWQPGEEKGLPFFVPYEELGLTLTGPEPWVLRGRGRGFGYTELAVGAGQRAEFKIPYGETVELSVICPAGFVRMYLGDSDVPIAVDPQNNHVARYPWDMIAYLTFEADEDAEVYVKAEAFADRGWKNGREGF